MLLDSVLSIILIKVSASKAKCSVSAVQGIGFKITCGEAKG